MPLEDTTEFMPVSLSEAFGRVVESEGATFKPVAFEVAEDKSSGAGFMFSFKGDLDLTKYDLNLGDYPTNLDVSGDLTIDQEHFFVIENSRWNVQGDIKVSGEWRHAIPVEYSEDLSGYLTNLVEESSAAIGGKVEMVIS